ncbi:MAG: VWA domain-containing protein [Candidatus Kapabacteria bacterium]|nr:VWA domain-containing protein [Candidatus Kapabacteria bacterium]
MTYSGIFPWGIVILLVILLSNPEANSIEYYPLRVNSSAYPEIEIESILIDNEKFVNQSSAGLTLTENGAIRIINNFDCPGGQTQDTTFSLLFVIDMSQSMAGQNFVILKQALIDLLQNFKLNNSQIAITGFNNINFLIHDFSNDKTSLISSLNNITFNGSTDINAAFLSEPADAIGLIESTKNRREIVLITDGTESGNKDLIIAKLLQTGARLHTVTFNFPVSPLIASISAPTKGCNFEKINNQDDFKKAIYSLAYLSKFNQTCKFSFNSFTCNTENTLNLNFSAIGFNTNINLNIAGELLPHLVIEPAYFYFGLQKPPSSPTKKFTLTAKNGDISITDFVDNPIFKVISLPRNFLLKSGESKEITVQFEPIDTAYIYSEIKITGNHCNGGLLRLAGGSDHTSEIDKTIRVVSPNGGEILFTGGYYKIEWDGVLPGDTVRIDYSLNNGNSWINITNSATGLSYNWRGIPFATSNNCLIRVGQLSKYDLSKNIISLRGIQGGVVNLVWKDLQNEIYTGSKDGFIRLWNAANGEPVKTISGNITNLLDFDISPDFKFVAFITENSNWVTIRNADNEFEEYKLSVPGEEILHIDWNPVNNFIAAACASGNIYVWDFPSTTPVKQWNYTSKANSLQWDKAGEQLAVGCENGFARILKINEPVIEEIKASDQRINSTAFNPTGKVLVTSSMSEIIRIWNIATDENIISLYNDNKPVNVVSRDPSGTFTAPVASASVDSAVVLWNPGDGSKYYTFKGHNNYVNRIKWRNDGKRIASSTIQGEVFVWSPDDIPFNRPTLQEDSSDNVWSIINPNIKTKSVVFARMELNSFKDSLVQNIISNPHNSGLYIDTIYIRGGSNSFSIESGLPDFPFYLNGLSGLDLKIRFNPKVMGSKLDTIIYKSGEREFRTFLYGYTDERIIEVFPKNHNFGIVKVGSVSQALVVNIKNISSSDVFIDNINEIFNNDSQFEVRDFTPGFILPDNSIDINVYYKPNRTFMSGALYDVDYDGKIGPEYISLVGIGAAPQISFIPEINLPEIVCENTVSRDVWIYNTGNDILNIQNIQLSDNSSPEFTLDLSVTNFNIVEKDSAKLILNFNGIAAGDYQSEIVITSNMNADKTIENIIKINLKKAVSDFKLSADNLLFFVYNTNEPQTKEITVHNTGTVPITFALPVNLEYFEIESVIPAVTLPGESSKVRIKFKGAAQFGQYSDVNNFSDSCGKSIILDLSAYVGPNAAEITTVDDIQFPEIMCSPDSTLHSLILKNTGTTPLLISSLTFRNSEKVFSLVENFEETNLPSGEEKTFILKFKPLNSGISYDTLVINSNAVNYPSGIKDVKLSGFYGTADFVLSDKIIELKGLLQGETASSVFEIENRGSLELLWDINKQYNYFTIDSVSPNPTPVGKTSKVYFTFKGGNYGETYSELINLTNICGSIDSVRLNASVDGSAKTAIKAGSANAKPGDTIEIPIFIFSPDNSELPDVAGYKSTIVFNSTLLVPLEDYTGFVTDGLRHIDLILPSKPINPDGSALKLRFLATLGNSDSSLISVSKSIVIGSPETKLLEIDGIFNLDSLCFEGGVRLIGNSGKILRLGQNFPNPVDFESKIRFSVIENGNHLIVIYDLLGKPLRTLFNAQIPPGDYEIVFNLDELPAGNYIYQLITPTAKLLRKMTINR